jgi:hypothetical protein
MLTIEPAFTMDTGFSIWSCSGYVPEHTWIVLLGGAASIAAWIVVKPGVAQLVPVVAVAETVPVELTHRELAGDAKAAVGRTASPDNATIEAPTNIMVVRLKFISLLFVGIVSSPNRR